MLHLYLPLLLFYSATMITPGPNNIMLMMCSSAFGIKRTLPHYFGGCAGFIILVIGLGYGLSTIFAEHPYIHNVVKIIGAIYMLYMAWNIAFTTHLQKPNTAKRPLTFIQAILFQLANPKSLTIIISVIASYTTTRSYAPSLFKQITIISIISFIMSLIAGAIWLFGGALLKLMLKHQFHFKLFNYGMGILLVISVGCLFSF